MKSIDINYVYRGHSLEQLKKYAEWDKAHYHDSKDRQHILDWAIEGIERLYGEQELSDLASDLLKDEKQELSYLASDLLQELQVCRKFIGSRERMHSDGLVMLDELIANSAAML